MTERKRSEELAKKELLLREIHHRVKNNLQVVSSLLYLQSQQVGDPRLAAILEENRHRIRSIALIHEKLYQSKDPGEVRFAAYLRDLLNHLLIAYGASASAVRPELAVDEGEAFGLDTAILLGLLVSELVSNALKHAFPRGTGGVIRIALERIGADGLRLEVGDDGVGLPPECDPATSRSMGLMLVQLFAKQLEAVLEVERGGGTRFVFLFRTPELDAGLLLLPVGWQGQHPCHLPDHVDQLGVRRHDDLGVVRPARSPPPPGASTAGRCPRSSGRPPR